MKAELCVRSSYSTGKPGKASSRNLFAAFGIAVLASTASTACAASDRTLSPAYSAQKPAGTLGSVDPVGSLASFKQYAKSHEWTRSPAIRNSPECERLFGELLNPTSIREVTPRIEATSIRDSVLAELARCEIYQAKERADAPRPNNYIEGASDFGDQFFRLFRVKSRFSNVPWDIVYGEFREEKLSTNEYADGFTVVDLGSCKKLSSVPVQRPMKGDQESAASRQVMTGLFDLQGRIVLLTVTEQVGHLHDPSAFRSIDAWVLKGNGSFSQSCSWNPTSLVKATDPSGAR